MEVELCALYDCSSLRAFLADLGFSKSFIKSFNFSKKKLDIKISSHQQIRLPIELLNNGMINPNYIGPEISIINENDRFISFSKPYRVHSHPQNYLDQNNVLSFLRSIDRGRDLSINILKYDRGLLHRLDYETSGVLIYCKDEMLHSYLMSNDVMKKKYYLAIVHGKVPFSQSKISNFLEPFGPGGAQMRVSPSHEGLEADMEYTLLQYNEVHDLCLVLVKLNQGRRHQIRVQLSSINHPILGDELYGGSKADRMFLHSLSYELTFDNMTYHFNDFSCPLFASFFDLNCCLQMLHDKFGIS